MISFCFAADRAGVGRYALRSFLRYRLGNFVSLIYMPASKPSQSVGIQYPWQTHLATTSHSPTDTSTASQPASLGHPGKSMQMRPYLTHDHPAILLPTSTSPCQFVCPAVKPQPTLSLLTLSPEGATNNNPFH